MVVMNATISRSRNTTSASRFTTRSRNASAATANSMPPTIGVGMFNRSSSGTRRFTHVPAATPKAASPSICTALILSVGTMC